MQGLAAEVLVCDTGSDDATVVLAQQAGARVIQLPWEGFGTSKNKANALASHPWILQLDADETADDTLIQQLQHVNWNETDCVYRIKRISFFNGRRIRFGAWKNDYQLRLFHRNHAHWTADPVHERLFFQQGRVNNLGGSLQHYTATSAAQYQQKMERYALLSATKYLQQQKGGAAWKQYVSPVISFLRNYCWRLGFLDGWAGWQLACITARYTHRKYARLLQLQHPS